MLQSGTSSHAVLLRICTDFFRVLIGMLALHAGYCQKMPWKLFVVDTSGEKGEEKCQFVCQSLHMLQSAKCSLHTLHSALYTNPLECIDQSSFHWF